MSIDLPAWWYPLLERARHARAEDFTRLRTPATGGRPSAVLVLLGEEEPG
ncbi:MAG: coenzyme A pyrophosphatase, partial [Actinobacteria bacterium]